MPGTPKKYITVNGVMMINPEYADPGKAKAMNNSALAVVSSPDDIMVASQVQQAEMGISVPIAQSTSAAVAMMQEEDLLAQFKSGVPLDGGEVLDQIGQKFVRYEVPLGMVNKLMMLTEYRLDFLVDDSGSMSNSSDVDALDASEPVKTLIKTRLGREPKAGEKMTRLEEAEDRLHIMMSILAYVPVEHMQLRFLNDRKPFIFDRTNKKPEVFEEYAHKEIRARFKHVAQHLGSTPVYAPLKIGFDYAGKWSHYLFNDGAPDEGGLAIAQQIINRQNPENHCLTLLSCTDNDADTAWMKMVDGKAKFVAELDDYHDEHEEVAKKQGVAFPFSRGLWLLNQLVASFNPHDLDALDESLLLTRFTLSNILGRQLNPREYQYYFEKNPNASLYIREYERFLNHDGFAYEILAKNEDDAKEEQNRREIAAGYVDGERPENKPIPDIRRYLEPITEASYSKFSQQFAAPAAQMSAANIAPHAAFMPARPNDLPPPYAPPAYEYKAGY